MSVRLEGGTSVGSENKSVNWSINSKMAGGVLVEDSD
jgi:hypothetical protein